MYRAAASGIRWCGSKSGSFTPEPIHLEARGCAIFHQHYSLRIYSKFAVDEDMGHHISTSGKRFASKMNAWGLNDNPSELHPSRIARDRVGIPPMTGPSDSTMKTPRKSCGPSLSAPCTPQSIDLEARGFAILGQQYALPNSKAAFNEDMGHRASTSGKSSGKMSQRIKSAFQRGFSSHEEQIPVIDNLIYCDSYDRQMDNLKSLRDCLSEGSILKTIKPGGLFRQVDLQKFGNLSLANLGFHVLRQLTAISTLNLMRGLNICELIKLDNLLWSPRHKGVVLSNTRLVVGSESKGCPYAAIKKLFDECLEISMDVKPEHVRLPVLLRDFLELLKYASHVDKRRINSHPVILFPGERIQRKLRINHVLRQDLPRGIEAVAEDDLFEIRAHADVFFRALSEVFPSDLLEKSGLHPLIDCWAREGQKLRGAKMSDSPVSVFIFKDGTLPLPSQIELGKILVALHRDPFEHLYQPLFLEKWRTPYTTLDVDQLLNTVNPLYGPTANYCFMITGCWHLLEVDPGCKPLYIYWTDISEEPLPKN